QTHHRRGTARQTGRRGVGDHRRRQDRGDRDVGAERPHPRRRGRPRHLAQPHPRHRRIDSRRARRPLRREPRRRRRQRPPPRARRALVSRNIAVEQRPGSGAAGCLAFGLAAFLGAAISSGFDAVSDALGLYYAVRDADIVVTGEGRLDEQTAYFKGPFALARLARMQGKKVVTFVGQLATPSSAARGAFDEIVVVPPKELAPEEAKKNAAALLEASA